MRRTNRGEDLKILYDVPFEVNAQLGQISRSVRDILKMGDGSVIELDREAGSLVDLTVNGKMIARGEIVEVDGYYGVRVTELM